MKAMGRESDMRGDAAEVEEVEACEARDAADGGAWYALRVAPRASGLGGCQIRPIDREVRRRESDITLGTSSLPEIGTPFRPEFVVEAALLRRGYEAWVPAESLWIRRNRFRGNQKKLVHQPILVGYVLVRLGSEPNWHRVLNFPMVRGVVGFLGVPARIRPKGIAKMRGIERRAQARAYQRLMPTRRTFDVGDEVEVLEGPFEGFIVTIVGLTGVAAKFETMLFGRSASGEIPLGKIGKLG